MHELSLTESAVTWLWGVRECGVLVGVVAGPRRGGNVKGVGRSGGIEGLCLVFNNSICTWWAFETYGCNFYSS